MDFSETKHLPKIDHTPSELDAPSKLLLKAAAILEEHGHIKCDLGGPGYGFCVLGALHYADHGSACGSLSEAGFIAVYERLEPAVGGYVVNWNNRAERTKEEVISKLRAVALGL